MALIVTALRNWPSTLKLIVPVGAPSAAKPPVVASVAVTVTDEPKLKIPEAGEVGTTLSVVGCK